MDEYQRPREDMIRAAVRRWLDDDDPEALDGLTEWERREALRRLGYDTVGHAELLGA